MRKISMLLCALVCLVALWPAGMTLPASATTADWVRTARIGGLSVDPSMSASEVSSSITQSVTENVSVLEVDSGLSNYMTET